MNTPQSTETLLDTTIQALTNGEHATDSGQALVDDWLNELAHYDGLAPIREALSSLQKALLNQSDPVQIRVLLMELAEYTQAFAQQPTTPNPAALQQLADTLQRLLNSSEEIGHS
ncbi:hypothetical protein [Fibrivirga algicola]|uniref:Uncharacterized protein n=1 Tax=Fibrivirga algicola TaxID=2950420 RepID=A0ABX0QLT5_9BACT|nr:hypothetical protein [Fibrivirga algicola]NID11852.1 hypothetical protein [Fibrivirga algicola]